MINKKISINNESIDFWKMSAFSEFYLRSQIKKKILMKKP